MAEQLSEVSSQEIVEFQGINYEKVKISEYETDNAILTIRKNNEKFYITGRDMSYVNDPNKIEFVLDIGV
jgi:hypothetical protein